MNWPHISYVIVTGFAALLATIIAIFAWRRRQAPGGAYFSALMIAVAVWALGNALESGLRDFPDKFLATKFSYFGIVSVAPLWLLFALHFSQRGPALDRRRIALLWALPIVVLALAFTNEWHGLIWANVTAMPTEWGSLLVFEHAIGVQLHVTYAYVLVLIGALWLLRAALRSTTLYRRQVAALVAGALLPLVSNIVYVLGFSPWLMQDITPITFAVTGLTLAYALFRFHMLDIVPVARDTLIERMAEGVLVLDQRNRIVDANPAASQLLGRMTANLVGRPASAVLPGWSDLWQQDGNSTTPVETALDQGRWLSLNMSALYDRRQRPGGRLIVLRDISARKQAGAELHNSMVELEASNAELRAFAHTVAHDLKNPLSIIIGFSELLRDGLGDMPPETAVQHLDQILKTGLKMSNIIHELLLLAGIRRIEEVPMAPLDMAAILAEAQQRLGNLAAEKGAEIAGPQVWPTALGYAPWVEEVWVNYLSNALKYGGRPEQGLPPRVELGCDRDGVALENGHIRFWIKDNGPGLSEAEQAQIFTEFTRLHQVQIEGFGLGLSIVRRIMSRLGGEVGVESQAGQGSTFWFTLPAAG